LVAGCDHDNVLAASTRRVYNCITQAQLITQTPLVAGSTIISGDGAKESVI
jgi:hypothetical protein